ncbi:hypothetical protein CMO94_02970 [Candidatus Woesearchaeota archaeon]|jgi:hypothetical protein|nr:hypothetical protein [Candidatus Woesearchaeota archaeon]
MGIISNIKERIKEKISNIKERIKEKRERRRIEKRAERDRKAREKIREKIERRSRDRLNAPQNRGGGRFGARRVMRAGSGLMGGVAARTVPGAGVDTGDIFLILAILIFFLDLSGNFGGRYSGFDIIDFSNSPAIGLNILMSGVFASFIAIFIIRKLISREWESITSEILSFGLFAFVITGFLILNYWIASPKASIHFVYWILFGLTFIKSNEDDTGFYMWTSIFLLVDFFGYRLLENLVMFRYLSFLVVITAFYVYDKSKSTLAVIVLVIVTIFTLGFAYADAVEQGAEGFPIIANTEGPNLEQTKDAAIEGGRNIYNSWQRTLSRQIEFAITGKVEENQYEPLGVYLERVQSAEPRYYEGEPVVVWGTVIARTLNDPINITVGCYIKEGNKKENASKVDPGEKFEVFTLEELDFACTFNGLDAGSGTITTFADFNFETLAYLKVYFIDDNRKRAMVREDLDVLEEFDITDDKPVSIFTNGPIEIGVETTTSLIGVRNNYNDYPTPTLSISLKNRGGWQGEIRNLNELVLFLPDGAKLKTGSGCEFEDYFLEDCIASCDDDSDKCKETCESLFEGRGKDYSGHSLVLSDPRVKDDLKDFERFKFFRCKFDPSKVLENTPITTKFFRVKAKYDYTVEEPVTVIIGDILDDGNRISPPTNLKLSPQLGQNSRLVLNWDLSKDDGSGEKDIIGYNVYRKKVDGEYELITDDGLLPNGQDNFQVYDIGPPLDYCYQVEAVDKDRNTVKSEEECFSGG